MNRALPVLNLPIVPHIYSQEELGKLLLRASHLFIKSRRLLS